MLQDYISAMERMNNKGNLKVKMEKMVLLAKKQLLAFYVRNGFMATGVSPVVHGKEQWFELERAFATSDEKEESHECYLVDSFADGEKQGSGNPAAVVYLNEPPGSEKSVNESKSEDSDSSLDKMDEVEESEDKQESEDRGVLWMATVAREFNQSETAFIWPLPHKEVKGSNGCLCPTQKDAPTPAYAIRYYTRSGVEVDLCGHATLAAALVLLLPKKLEDAKHNHKVAFFAKNDELEAELLVPPTNAQSTAPASTTSNKTTRIAMNFPWKNVTPLSTEKYDKEEVLNMLSSAFSGAADEGEASRFLPFQHVLQIGTTDGNEDLLVELTEEGFDVLRGIKVDYGALTTWQGYSRGVIVCCCCASAPKIEINQQPTPSIDFRSRFFGPKVGIDEDPVTGSAHCSLGPYFGNKLGKTTVVGRQESERGGIVECHLKPAEGRVCIVGTAVMTLSGKLSISI
jgi:predicted PhzF superfamily epimerase YddE/YHI9